MIWLWRVPYTALWLFGCYNLSVAAWTGSATEYEGRVTALLLGLFALWMLRGALAKWLEP